MFNKPHGIKTITLADGESLSPAVDITKYSGGLLFTDDALDACDLAMLVSDTVDGDYYKADFVDDAVRDSAYVLPDDAMYGNFAKFQSLDAGTTDAAAQVGDVVLTLVLIEEGLPRGDTQPKVKDIVIAAAGQNSSPVDLVREAAGVLWFPSDWEAQNVTFQVAASYGGAYAPLYDFDGTGRTLTAPAASTVEHIPSDIFKAPFMRIVSAVAQTAGCTVRVATAE